MESGNRFRGSRLGSVLKEGGVPNPSPVSLIKHCPATLTTRPILSNFVTVSVLSYTSRPEFDKDIAQKKQSIRKYLLGKCKRKYSKLILHVYLFIENWVSGPIFDIVYTVDSTLYYSI